MTQGLSRSRRLAPARRALDTPRRKEVKSLGESVRMFLPGEELSTGAPRGLSRLDWLARLHQIELRSERGQVRGDEVDDGDWFVTAGTESAGPNPTAELLAIGTPLLAEVPGLAVWTFVDDVGATSGRSHRKGLVRDRGATVPEGLLATAVRAPALTASGTEAAAAERADRGVDHRYAIATQRATAPW